MALALFGMIIGIAAVGVFFYYRAVKIHESEPAQPREEITITEDDLVVGKNSSTSPILDNIAREISAKSKRKPEEEQNDDAMFEEHGYPICRLFTEKDHNIYHRGEIISKRGWADLDYTIVELSRLPSDATELLEILNDQNSSASDVARICSKSVGFTARVLKIVNSPYYGLQNEVDSVQQAVAMLGFEELRQIIYTSSVFRSGGSPTDQINIQELWKHSLATSKITSWLIEKIHSTGNLKSETGFREGLAGTSALLHDIGKLVLQRWRPEGFRKALSRSHENNTSLMSEELKELGVTHALAGELLIDAWRLPKSLSITVKNSHHPVVSEDFPEAALIWLSGQVTRSLSMGIDGEKFNDEIPTDVGVLFGIDERSVNELVSDSFEQFVEDVLTDCRTAIA